MKKTVSFLVSYFVLTVFIFQLRPFGESNLIAEVFAYYIAILLAAISALLALKSYGRGPRFRSLLCFTLGLFFWVLGEASYLYQFIDATTRSYPALGDYLYLFGFILLFFGILFEVIAAGVSWKKISKRVYLTAGIFSTLSFIGYAYLTVFSLYDPTAPLTENIVTIFFTMSDLLILLALFFLIILAWEYRGGKATRVWIGLFVGFFLGSCADLFVATYTSEIEQRSGLLYIICEYLYIFGFLSLTYAFIYLKTLLQVFQKRVAIKNPIQPAQQKLKND